jgi:hypothetical protein
MAERKHEASSLTEDEEPTSCFRGKLTDEGKLKAGAS